MLGVLPGGSVAQTQSGERYGVAEAEGGWAMSLVSRRYLELKREREAARLRLKAAVAELEDVDPHLEWNYFVRVFGLSVRAFEETQALWVEMEREAMREDETA